jgi:hypothetical protein
VLITKSVVCATIAGGPLRKENPGARIALKSTGSITKGVVVVDRDVENPMVIDSVWPNYDEIDRETRDEIERQKADEYYDDLRWRQERWQS